MYAITANVVSKSHDGWTTTTQVPTFYLDENVQGIISEEHAAKIARSVIDPLDLLGEVYVTAVKL